MADLTITTDTYKDLLKAADAAFGKIGNWMKSTVNDNNIFAASNKQLGASLNEIEERIKRVEALKGKSKDPSTIARLDKIKNKYENDKQDIQDRSDTVNRKGWGDAGKKVLDSGIDKLIGGAPALLQMGMAAQTAQVSFERLTHSSAAASEIIKDLHHMSATSLFDNDKLQENATTLLESGFAAGKLMPVLSMLGDVSGGSQTKMDALSKVFGDLQQEGHLTSESLKEMNDAGFKPLEIMAANSGQTMEQLQASMEAGGISTESVINSLQIATAKGGEFFGVMKEQSETAAGKWHGLKEKMSEAGATIGNALMPTVSNFLDNTLMPLVNWLSAAAEWISRNADTVGFLTTVVAAATLGYKAWTIAAELLGGAVAGSGVGLAVTIIAALIGVVIYAWNTFGWFRGAIMGAWEILKGFANMIWTIAIAPIKSLISGISNIGHAVMYLFNGDWDKAWESGKEAIKDLSGFNTAQTLVSNMKDMGGKAADAFHAEVSKKQATSKGPAMATPVVPTPVTLPGGGKSAGGGASNSFADTTGAWTPDATRKKMALENSKDTVSGITNGGARTVNISLQKLFETINITTNTVSEGISNMEQQVTDALLQILKTANATA